MRVALGRVRPRPLIIHCVGRGGLIVLSWPGLLLGVVLFGLVCLVLVDVMVFGLVGFLLVAAVLVLGGFGGSVPVVVLVLAEQLEG